MTRVEENNGIIGMIAQFADEVSTSKNTSKDESYRLALTAMSTTLMDISKSLAVVADSLSERKE